LVLKRGFLKKEHAHDRWLDSYMVNKQLDRKTNSMPHKWPSIGKRHGGAKQSHKWSTI